MSIRTPIVLTADNSHDVLPAGDSFAGRAVQLSADAGNAITLGSDGGLYALQPKRVAVIDYNGSSGESLANDAIGGISQLDVIGEGFSAGATYTVGAGTPIRTFKVPEGVYDVAMTTAFMFLPSNLTTGGSANCSLVLLEITEANGAFESAIAHADVFQAWQASVDGLVVNRHSIHQRVPFRADRAYAIAFQLRNAGATPRLNIITALDRLSSDGTVTYKTTEASSVMLEIFA